MLELIFLEGGQPGLIVRLTFEKAWFGRQSTCDFVLDGEGIGPVHFSISRRGSDYILIDNKSATGTFVNGVRCEETTLRAGDDIVAGSSRMQVREAAAHGHPSFRFVAEQKGVEGGPQVIEQETVLLGRKSACAIQLNDPAVDAVHAAIEHRGDGIWITDESSGAGVYVNGQRVVRQQLRDGDVVTIRPFEIAISSAVEMCFLRIEGRTLELPQAPESQPAPEWQPAPAEVPEGYREVVVAPVREESGQAKPSAAIAGLPRWMRAKAPIWVPSSDILPNRWRSGMLLMCVVGVAGWAAIAFAAKWNVPFSPGPLTEAHATIGCASCHSSFGQVADTSCQGCHGDKTATAIHSRFTIQSRGRAQKHVGCTDCHSEHRGAKFDIAREVGGGCQSAGCHVTVHAAEKSIVAQQVSPAGSHVPGAVALAAHFQAGDAMHEKHANLAGSCAACHTGGNPGLLETPTVTGGAGRQSGSPTLTGGAGGRGVGERAKELKDIRMRCLGCHGFGPEATLRERCYSCHLEHPMDRAEIITVLRFPDSDAARAKPARSNLSGLLMLVVALVAVPVFVIVVAAGGIRIHHRRSVVEAAETVGLGEEVSTWVSTRHAESVRHDGRGSEVRARPDGRASEAHALPDGRGSETNQAPGGHLRPRVDLDLCVGCGTCAHVCPFNVLEIVNEKAIAARLGDCTGFAACVAECPTEAIVMVTGGAMQTVELPVYDANLETNVAGLYLAGEVTGKALIKVAINQGKKVVESILRGPEPEQKGVSPQGTQDHVIHDTIHDVIYDVIVVGAGPAGTSAALAAKSEGLKVLVLEQGTHANTIRSYPRQKFVMAEPVMLPVYGPLWLEDTSKEALLERWQEIIASTGLAIREEEKVLRVVQSAGGFLVQSSKREYRGARVVLAIGKRGSPRRLGVPGEDTSKVVYNLSDAEAYRGKALCIVGGGDSAVEAVNGLARPDLENRVWLVYRGGGFSAAKARNQKKLKKYVDDGRVTVLLNSTVAEIRERSVVVKTAEGLEELDNDFLFAMLGGESPKQFLSECGIEFSERALG